MPTGQDSLHRVEAFISYFGKKSPLFFKRVYSIFSKVFLNQNAENNNGSVYINNKTRKIIIEVFE